MQGRFCSGIQFLSKATCKQVLYEVRALLTCRESVETQPFMLSGFCFYLFSLFSDYVLV